MDGFHTGCVSQINQNLSEFKQNKKTFHMFDKTQEHCNINSKFIIALLFVFVIRRKKSSQKCIRYK